jgi:hypothetical protein
MKKLLIVLVAAGIGGCATPAVVMISTAYNPAQVKRVALVSFRDFPGSAGSGGLASDTFEKYLLWGGYGLVERRQVQQLLSEQSLQATDAIDPATIKSMGKILGVDALALGSLTDYTGSRDQTVMVDEPQEQSDPVYGTVTTVQRSGDTRIRSTQQVVTGYATTTTDTIVPETQTVPAHAALTVRLVSVETGEILWEGSADSDGVDLNAATEQASAKIMQAVVQKLKKFNPPK